MSNNLAPLMSSKEQGFLTPQWFFDCCNGIWRFDFDAAATDESAKCENYATPERSCLSNSWPDHCRAWMNPEYGKQLPNFLRAMVTEVNRENGCVVGVALTPARTDTKWFHDIVLPNAAQIILLKGRLKFEHPYGDKTESAPFPSMLSVFVPHHRESVVFYTAELNEWKKTGRPIIKRAGH